MTEEMTSNSIIGNVRIHNIAPYPLHVEFLQAAYASKNINKTIERDALLDILSWVPACLAFEV
jgi:hypothetical protein